MSNLRTIVYVSTATHLLSTPQLESLLIEARDLNLQHSVTGVLLYNNGSFMQCFEGPAPFADETYARIRASRKHKNIIELLHERIGVRAFPAWQMGFAQPSESELLALSTAHWESMAAGTGGSLPTSMGLILLQDFWGRVRK